MSKFLLKNVAIKLRKEGKSIGYIAKNINASKSSVKRWCGSVILSDEQKNILNQNSIDGRNKGRLMGAEKNRKKKEDRINFFINDALDKISTLSVRDLELISAALYWAEGAKTESRFMFVNSDPKMVKIMYCYITQVLNIPKDQLNATVQINYVHKERIGVVLKFWSDLLGLPISSFGNTYYVKTAHKKVYDNHNSYYGILRLKISRGSDYQYKMLGIINAINVGVAQVVRASAS